MPRCETPTPLEVGALELLTRLREEGWTAFYAGGCVRDLLRKVPPSDIDIATDATPETVERLFPHHHSVGAHFGVVVVHACGFQYEVATFRADLDYRDGRRPEGVRFAGPREDAERRDFTINGMFFDPCEGCVTDYVGGRADLAAGRVRAIGDPRRRFAEDFLRLLRAVRFATTLDFQIDVPTWEAVKDQAPSISAISAERIREELMKTLLTPNRLRGFDLLDESGLLKAILPEVDALKGCEQPPQFHPEGDVFVHTRLMLSLLPPECSPTLLLATLLHDIGKPATQSVDAGTGRIRFSGHDRAGARMAVSILRRLRFSRDQIEAVEEAVRCHMMFKDVKEMRPAKLKRFMARPWFDDELELHRVDCLGSHGLLDNYEFMRQKEKEFASAPLIPPPLVTGHDLIQLGFTEGPLIGRILREVQTRQLENRLTSREEALEWVRAHYEPGSGKTL